MPDQRAWRKGKNWNSIVSDVCAEDGLAGSEELEAYGGYLIAESVPPSLVPLICAAPDLLAASKAQQEAIDRLFAMLILSKTESRAAEFLPSKSGQPWQAFLQGNKAIEKAEAKP